MWPGHTEISTDYSAPWVPRLIVELDRLSGAEEDRHTIQRQAGPADRRTGTIRAYWRSRRTPMCRSIKTLAHLEPPASDEEIRAAALQFVRKLSGANRPSRANELAFDRAVDDVTVAASRLLRSLTTSAPPRQPESEVPRRKVATVKVG
jgi:hypothetical protein